MASLLPPTSNEAVAKSNGLALYNETLTLAAQALFQHGAVFGIIFLLRGFSSKRALDLHFLTIIFALSFIAAPLIFLVDTRIDATKLLFFLEHEAIEYIIAIRVLAPNSFVKNHPGLIILLCWTALAIVSILVSLNTEYHHAADIVAWGAFTSDGLVAVAGGTLIWRWFKKRQQMKGTRTAFDRRAQLLRRKQGAEAMGGLGFLLHGFSTMTIGPILTSILYHGTDPAYFAYGWVIVFFFAIFVIALSVPSAAIFFSTINWCCWHDRKTLPGEARWTEDDDLEGGQYSRSYLQERITLRGLPTKLEGQDSNRSSG